jgi:hypothetical protein
VADDRDFSWMGRPRPTPPIYPEHVVCRVVKGTRWHVRH